jgi:ribosomal protein S18 acetylase RimI-like enzyme
MIRKATKNDFDSIDSIGTNSYPDNYYEGVESFRSKMIAYPDGCFVCQPGDDVTGYIISFPYILFKPYPINCYYKNIEHPTCYYIHDLCVLKEHRGNGYASALVNEVLKIKSYPKALMSVLDSNKFWERFGFKPHKTEMYYGMNATYMIRLSNR